MRLKADFAKVLSNVTEKTLREFFSCSKILNLRKIKPNNRIRLVLPQFFYCQTFEIPQPIFEQRLKSRDQKRLAEAPRASKEKLTVVLRQLTDHLRLSTLRLNLATQENRSGPKATAEWYWSYIE